MRYMGGKCRQSRAISDVLRRDNGVGFAYCEPFAGAMWSASRVIIDARSSSVFLSDILAPLIRMWEALVDGSVVLPRTTTDDEYNWYKDNRSTTDDPLLAWFGHGVSFGGKWFGGLARHNRGMQDVYDLTPQVRSTMQKVDVLRTCDNLIIECRDYLDVIQSARGKVIYCDPPYEGRTKAHLHHSGMFDYALFWNAVRDASVYNRVYTSCFDCPPDFDTVYEWGDTVIRYHGKDSGAPRANEKLVVYRG